MLTYSLAIVLGFITCLSSFMLGTGQGDYMLPTLMTAAAVSSFYLTDYRRIIRLGDWTVNVLVLLIAFCTLGEILHNQGEDLALSIARVLVFVQMVLLFRGKETSFCWQILLISLLQVLVASALQQSILFGALLVAYIFAGLCAFVLIFLQQEHHYFRRHSFSATFLDTFKAGFTERFDRGRLARIALMTLLTGPLTLVFSFGDSAKKKKAAQPDTEKKTSAGEILRSLFAVFPTEHRPLDRWETIDNGAAEPPDAASPPVLVPVPSGLYQAVQPEHSGQHLRFPLLAERPSFFGGTMSVSGLEGGRRELLTQLVRGMFFAVVFAAVLFCLIPRIGKIEFNGYPLKFGYDQWMSAILRPVNSVGFREEVRLGSLGTVLPYHREVLSVKFVKYADKQIPPSREDTKMELPYHEISGATLYFRGVALDEYADGTWKPVRKELFPFPETEIEDMSFRSPYFETLRAVQNAATTQSVHPLLPGGTIRPDESSSLFFEDGIDLVGLQLRVQPLDTRVFFAPWPFVVRPFRGVNFLSPAYGRVEEQRNRRRELRTTVFSTAFKHGVQVPVVPCQEIIEPETLLQMPDSGLEQLKALARQWDKESNCKAEDIAGRAAFMEQKFLHSDIFSYQLGGTQRQYGIDPLEDFVTKNPQGHCEYFAGAFVLMLRSVGIPSRVIVGYKTQAADAADMETLIRQSDAHTWADVYLSPEYLLKSPAKAAHKDWWRYGGWLRFDPTPAEEATLMKTVSFTLTDLQEWIQTMWNTFVLNMDATRQMQWIYEPLTRLQYAAVDYFRNKIFHWDFYRDAVWGIVQYYRNLFGNSFLQWQVSDWGRLVVPIVLLVPLLYLLVKVLYQVRKVWGRSGGVERQRRETEEFYYRLEHLLAKAGFIRSKGETPRELVRRADYGESTQPVVEAFYRVRFGAEELNRREIREIQNYLRDLERSIVRTV